MWKKAVSWILSFFAFIGLGCCVFFLYRYVKNTYTVEKIPLIANGVTMSKGISMSLTQDGYPIMRFWGTVANEVKDEILQDENKSIGFLVAPLSAYEAVNVEKKACIDWMNAFSEEEKAVFFSEVTTFSDYDSESSLVQVLVEHDTYVDMNTRMAAWIVLIDETDGEPVYQYSALPAGETYQSNARSMAMSAGMALNFYAQGTVYADNVVATYQWVVNVAVDELNGVEISNDNSLPTVAFTSQSVTLYAEDLLDEGFEEVTSQISFTIMPKGLDVPVAYASADESIATVSADGLITTRGFGTTSIYVYVAGVRNEITVNVKDVWSVVV